MPPARLHAARLWAPPLLGALHVATYVLVTSLIDRFPERAFWQTGTALDQAIPHLPWTWPAYWAAFPFVGGVGTAVILRQEGAAFRRTILAFLLLIAAGAAGHLLLPARAPWPGQAHAVQRLFHQAPLIRPYATLPSMHVAYCVLTALIGIWTFRTRTSRVLLPLLTLLIAASTVTLKEHVILDVVSGAALGVAVALWWRRAGR